MTSDQPGPIPKRPQQISIGRSEQASKEPVMFDNPIARLDADVAAAIESVTDPKERIEAAIRQVHDPEIPVNVFDLGLIYEIDIDPDHNVRIQMTLTSPACPAAQELPGQVRRAVSQVPEVKDVEVDMTFDPPWSVDHMSDVAKVQLGMM
ncbi:MAG: DUF59 domain-containing protein [Phycisphaeraceae bacterium]|nr:DUF59 domain-containing protein [Phycisphaeraceae bacterium]